MTLTQRPHIDVTGDTFEQLGRSRGTQLGATLAAAYERYAELFRILGVEPAEEAGGAQRVLDALEAWRPARVEELAGIAAGSGLSLLQVAALNARTEIIALGKSASNECSTYTARIDGRNRGVQTWDWHTELAPFWHTQSVAGPGLRYAGLTEQGIVSKIGVNEAGLALHFNILGHREDAPTGVPMHVLSAIVLSECRDVEDAIALIESAPLASSSAFTMIDAERAVSVEMSPAGVRVIESASGSVQRTNHFQSEELVAGQKSEVYEPDSSQRLALVRERLAVSMPGDENALVDTLVTAPGQPALTCRPDMSKTYGERWATLATVITDPTRCSVRILDGMPTDARTGDWRELTV